MTNQRKARRQKMMLSRVDEAQRNEAIHRTAALEAIKRADGMTTRLTELEAMAIEHAKCTEKVEHWKNEADEQRIVVRMLNREAAEQQAKLLASMDGARASKARLAQAEVALTAVKVALAKAEESAKTKELKKARERLHEKSRELSMARTEIGRLTQKFRDA